MIVRKIKPTEIKRVNELCALSFEYGEDNTKSPEEIFENVRRNPQSRLDLAWHSRWAAFEDDDQTMMSCLSVIPYPVQFDGHHTTMMGIGGVASLPPYRRKGGIRACFEAALPDMYESGAVFSYLYPFSTAYYRKFGYEMCCERNRYQLLLDKLPFTQVGGSFHLIEQGKPWLAEIKTVYRAWQESYNMMIIGEAPEFAWVEKANPFKDQQYSYLYMSGEGIPKSYITFQKVDEPSGRNLKCSRFVFTDAEGFYGIVNLFVSLAADHRFVTFELPSSLLIEPLLPEWSMGVGQRENAYCGMARVVNVFDALKMARTSGDGALVLEIHDAHIPQNNGRFAVRFASSRVTEVSLTDEAPDVSLGIADFSRLLLGVYDTHMLRFLKNVTVHNTLSDLSALFFRKDMMIGEYF